MIHGFRAYLAAGGLLASALLLLTVLPYTTAATTQPQALFFRPMDLPTTTCPDNTAQRFDQDVDYVVTPNRLLDRTDAALSYTGTLMVPSVFAGRQAWLILRITNENPDTVGGAADELHEVFLTNANGETIFLGVIDETTITTTPVDLVFQIPQDFLTAGDNTIEVQLDETTPNQDPNVITADLGDITIDSMRVCYGGYYVYNIPLVCGFTPVDLNATGAPTYRTPAIKKGDYATNILLKNPDQALPTTTFNIELYIEFATTTPIASTGPINNYPENNIIPYGTASLGARQNNFLSCDGAADEVLAEIDVADPNVQLFWKGAFIITQPIGDGVETSKLPLIVQAVNTYELTENKIRYQILRDPTGTIPRHLIGTDLEMVVAISPFNQTRQGPGAFENLQIMRMIRNELVNGFGISPAAAERVVLRVIEASLGTGASQTITNIEPREAPLEPPGGGGG